MRGTYWADTVDLIIDNRKFEIPTYERARKYLKAQRVRCRYGVRPAFASSVRGGISRGRDVRSALTGFICARQPKVCSPK